MKEEGEEENVISREKLEQVAIKRITATSIT